MRVKIHLIVVTSSIFVKYSGVILELCNDSKLGTSQS